MYQTNFEEIKNFTEILKNKMLAFTQMTKLEIIKILILTMRYVLGTSNPNNDPNLPFIRLYGDPYSNTRVIFINLGRIPNTDGEDTNGDTNQSSTKNAVSNTTSENNNGSSGDQNASGSDGKQSSGH